MARIHVHLKQEKMKKVLKKNIIELQVLDKMKNDFLAVCSHDLRSPLSSILGYTELLMLEIENKNHLGMLKDILSSGEELLLLINDILDLSRAEPERQEMGPAQVEPAQIISGRIHSLEPAASLKHISLTIGKGLLFRFLPDLFTRKMEEAVATASESIKKLNRHIRIIEEISLDLHRRALNAVIKSASLGKIGLALEVLAQEVTKTSHALLNTAVQHISQDYERFRENSSAARIPAEKFTHLLSWAKTHLSFMPEFAETLESQSRALDKILSGMPEADMGSK